MGNQLVIRLNSAVDAKVIEKLKHEFSDIFSPCGDICLSGPFPEEDNEADIGHLPRLVLDFKRCDFGRLKELIDAINRC